MAKIIPKEFIIDKHSYSSGEEDIHARLKKFDSNLIAFHSVNWKRERWRGSEEGEADFILFFPEERVLLVIEVKSGEIFCEDMQWYMRNYRTKEKIKIKSPMEQADRSKHHFISLFGSSDLYICSAVWFPSISNQNYINPPDMPYEITLFKEDLYSMEEAFNRILNYYGKTHKYIVDNNYIDKIVKTIAPEIGLVAQPGDENDIYEKEFFQLTSEQFKILSFLESQPHASIDGAAGTGKTVLAMELAKKLSKDSKVLFLCFNNMLMNQLKQTLKSHRRITVYNLHSLLVQFMGEKRIFTNTEIEEFLTSLDNTSFDFDHIIVDEGQDFEWTQIYLLFSHCQERNNKFFVFYDKNQAVHINDTNEWLSLFDCRLILRINCRNTINVARTSLSVLDIDKQENKFEIIGDKARLFIREKKSSSIETLESIIKKYIDNGIPVSEIVILTMKTTDSSLLSGTTQLNDRPIAVAESRRNSILFTTVRKFKGLEAQVVILIDIDKDTFNKSKQNFTDNRLLFYAGTSRSKLHLDVFITEKNENLQLIEEYLEIEKSRFPVLSLTKYFKAVPGDD